MTIPPTAPYRAYWRKLDQKKPTPEQRLAARRARREARRLAKILAEEFGAKRVYLFGSFAWSVAWTRPESDIDLAVEGLADGEWWEAIGRLEDETKYEFDLQTLENSPPHLHQRILESGLLIYDGQQISIARRRVARRNRKPAARAG